MSKLLFLHSHLQMDNLNSLIKDDQSLKTIQLVFIIIAIYYVILVLIIYYVVPTEYGIIVRLIMYYSHVSIILGFDSCTIVFIIIAIYVTNIFKRSSLILKMEIMETTGFKQFPINRKIFVIHTLSDIHNELNHIMEIYNKLIPLGVILLIS